MKKKVLLFDLDGTLLPMDQDNFTKGYFKHLCAKLAPYGYEKESLTAAVWQATKSMVCNNGTATNEAVFWKSFQEILGESVIENINVFDDFYANEFHEVKKYCGYNSMASAAIHQFQKDGYRIVLATNPIFPRIATEARIRWAGCTPQDFEFCTTYENSSYCKPNPDYYKEILDKIGAAPQECVMIGNDVTEDMIAEVLGMDVFLLSDCLINAEHKDISQFNQGSFDSLLRLYGSNNR